MSAEIIPFDFEEQAVRVVMRGDDPWFVAADVCRVLELGNTSQAASRLDDDERDGIITDDTAGRSNRLTVINESGLYALVLTSRKDAARRFRKWITADVLPAIRQHGRYELPEAAADPSELSELGARDWLALVREARLLGGAGAGRRMWGRSPLPPLADPFQPHGGAKAGQLCLAHLMARVGAVLAEVRNGTGDASALTAEGLRVEPAGLFVANFALPAFDSTAWGDGAHRAALLGLPGVIPSATVRTLARRGTRGLILPWELLDGEMVA